MTFLAALDPLTESTRYEPERGCTRIKGADKTTLKGLTVVTRIRARYYRKQAIKGSRRDLLDAIRGRVFPPNPRRGVPVPKVGRGGEEMRRLPSGNVRFIGTRLCIVSLCISRSSFNTDTGETGGTSEREE